jgi:hypothetical protein
VWIYKNSYFPLLHFFALRGDHNWSRILKASDDGLNDLAAT